MFLVALMYLNTKDQLLKTNNMSRRTEIATIIKEPKNGDRVTVKGWVRAFRNNRFVALNDGSAFNTLQVVIDENVIEEELSLIHI